MPDCSWLPTLPSCIARPLTLYLLVLSVGMMILSWLVLALANGRIYVPYTISSHNVAGEYMLAMSIAIAVICLPVYLYVGLFSIIAI